MYDSNLNKSKLNLNAPSYVPKNFKTFDNLFQSKTDNNISQFNLLDDLRAEENLFSPKNLNDLFSPKYKENFKLSTFDQLGDLREKDVYQINSIKNLYLNLGFMIDNSVINKICYSSAFNQQSSVSVDPSLRDFRSNLSHLINSRFENFFLIQSVE